MMTEASAHAGLSATVPEAGGIATTADLPADVQAFFAEIYRRSLTRFGAVIAAFTARPGLCEALARERVAILEEELAPIFPAMAAVGTPVACARGCGVCCTTTVEVTPEETFALMGYLERTLSPKEWAALLARARANDAVGHGLDPVDRHRMQLFCPVLDPETMACLAHPVRPAPCQGYLSVNLAQCQANFKAPPGHVEHPKMASMITSVVNGTRTAVLGDLGYSMHGLELTAAIVAAQENPDAEAAWLAGEPVLEGARYVVSAHDLALKRS